MKNARLLAAAMGAAAFALAGTALGAASGPTDAEIAHIAYTAGVLDVAAGKQALAKSHNAKVRAFAKTMVRDHEAVNGQALALVGKLKATEQAIQLDELIKWVTGQAAVDPKSGSSPSPLVRGLDER
jgi:predicted outer membrane protein